MYRLFLFAVIIFFCSCSGNDSPATDNGNSIETVDETENSVTVDSVLSAESFNSFDSVGFTTHAKESIQGFNSNSFKLVGTWKEDSLYAVPFQPEQSYFDKYGKLLRFNPDSTYFLDLDSYQIDISKDKTGKYQLDEMGPDTEVALVDTKSGIRKRLIFLGPSASIEEGVWLDKESLLLAGYSEIDPDSLKAFIYKIHVPTNTFSLYEFSDSGAARKVMGEWRKKRISEAYPGIKQ